MEPSYHLETVDYFHPRQQVILKACLTRWFQDPKDLNLTSPSLRYPFRFPQWLDIYRQPGITTYVLKRGRWICAHLSTQIKDGERLHLFHLIVDRDCRRQGLARRLIRQAEEQGKSSGCSWASLFVSPKNTPARQLYRELGYEQYGVTSRGSLKLKKDL